jgi:threonine synthase
MKPFSGMRGSCTYSATGDKTPSRRDREENYVKYVSTRGEAPPLKFTEALLQGLAADGGLYLPEHYPQIPAETIAGFATMAYADVAEAVVSPYVGGEIDIADLRAMIGEAYATFRHPAVAPLVQTGPQDWVCELFHGPTLAFKDFAMQLLARLMDHALERGGARATIVGATSGDTGGSAIDAFGGRQRTDVFILFPQGRVSQVQQRQMTTSSHDNVHAIAVEGDFDDCQAMVKAMFANAPFRDRFSLSGVNSINWARIMAQIVYYFFAASRLGAPWRKISFTVPTGNFGDIFAGYAAKRMGLSVDRLVIATNRNDILARTLSGGRYERGRVAPTSSPSMDIQVSSNFERLLFEAGNRDGAQVGRLMQNLSQSGAFDIPAQWLEKIREEFDAGSASEPETTETIRAHFAATGMVVDPHTAVGLKVAQGRSVSAPMVTLATAHPAKFPDAVEAATGKRPCHEMLAGDLMRRPERYAVLPNDVAEVERYISRHSRIGSRTPAGTANGT